MPLIGTLFNFLHRILPGAVLALMTSATLVAQIPQFEWVVRFGAANNELVRALDTDANGNIYAVGEFSGTVDFDPGQGTVDLTSPNTGGFILKLDPNGALLWALALNGSTNTFAVNDISVDPGGHAWVIGTFYGTMDVDPGPGVTTITSSGGTDVFFLRLDPYGTMMRYGRGGGPSDDTGNGIVSDDQGNAYMTGGIMASTTFQAPPNSTGMNAVGFTNPDVFVLKLPAVGDFEWEESAGSFFHDEGNAIALDDQGNVVVTGTISGPSDFGHGNPYILNGDGSKDVFVYKLSNAGAFIWANSVGPGQEDIARDIAIDAQNNIYTTGTFFSAVDFDPGAGVTTLDAQGGRKAFIQKLTPSGAFAWASTLESANYKWSSGICIGPSGKLLSTGYFQQTTDFDSGTGIVNLPFPSVSPEAFLQELDGNGNFIWAGPLGGPGWDHGLAVTADASSAIYVGGFFEQTADLDPGPSITNVISAGGRDAFLVKLDAGINTGMSDRDMEHGVRIWPNPCAQGRVNIELRAGVPIGSAIHVNVIDLFGHSVAGPFISVMSNSTTFSMDVGQGLAAGMYAVQIAISGKQLTERLVIE